MDDGKVTDHHALLVTGEKPLFLSKEDNTIYQMIAGRMVEAFSEKCVKDVTTVTAECAGVEFTVKGSVVKQTGWRAVYGEEKEEITIPGWQEGDTLTPKGSSITEGKTKPKPLHTEATLLSAMETAGKEIEDDALRQALKACGIGTPPHAPPSSKRFSSAVTWNAARSRLFPPKKDLPSIPSSRRCASPMLP